MASDAENKANEPMDPVLVEAARTLPVEIYDEWPADRWHILEIDGKRISVGVSGDIWQRLVTSGLEGFDEASIRRRYGKG